MALPINNAPRPERGLRLLGALLVLCAAVMLVVSQGTLAQSATEPQTEAQTEPQSQSGEAEQIPAPIIAVIDVNQVERRSEAWQSLRQQMEERTARFQSELQVQQRELEEEQRELQSLQNTVTRDELAERQQKFREKLESVQNMAREDKLALERAYAAARAQIRKALTEVTTEIARERGVNLMLNLSGDDATISFVDKNLVVSEEALRRLNERIKSVELSAQ